MSENPAAIIDAIHRYPVKGLSPEPLQKVALSVGQTLPADRRYAIENGPSGFDPAQPKYLPKAYFLMLMRHERLAQLHTRYDDETHVLSISRDGRALAQGNLTTADGRTVIEDFFKREFPSELKGPPKVLPGNGHSFSDVARKVVSIINLASVAVIGEVLRRQVDPLRFRGNVHVRGWPAWHEFDLVGQTLAIGDVRLKVVDTIVRCAAVDVDPSTGARDLDIPKMLQRRFGHGDCGVYAEVVAGGEIGAGNAVAVAQPRLI